MADATGNSAEGRRRLGARLRNRRRLKLVLLLAVGVAVTALALVLYSADSLRRLELDTVDTRFSIRGEKDPPKDLVVVGIDAATFDHAELGGIGIRWQSWRRTIHARVIRNLKRRGGAKVIAYDVQFTEGSTCPPKEEVGAIERAYTLCSRGDDDYELALATDAARPVVFATTEVDPDGRCTPKAAPGSCKTNVLGGDDILRKIGAHAAQGLLPPDPRGVLRRLPYEVDGLKSFGVVTAEVATGKPIPRPPRGRDAWIDYAGPPGTIPSVSFSDVFFNEFERGAFRNKIVVVGPTAPSLQDVHATSAGGGQMAGAEIQANAIATARSAFPMLSAVDRWNVLAIVVLCLVAPLASLRFGPSRALTLALAVGLAYLVIAQVAFNDGTVLSVIYPMGGLALSSVGALTVVYFTETRERRRLRTMFSSFVPQAVVDQVVDRAEDDLRLGGVRLTSTVLFSDLRGFTSFAERLGEEVIDVLNEYLGEMSAAIMDHGGTLVAYMGDGIMAVFGAPIEQEDHADRAYAAAKEMLAVRLPRFNEWLEGRGMPTFRMGIGLNSGPVMSGNVGSERRMEYTAVGDTTNTAARLEGMTKGTEFQLFVSDSTRSLLSDGGPELSEHGEMPVRGRQAALKVWGLPDEAIAPEAQAAPAATPASA